MNVSYDRHLKSGPPVKGPNSNYEFYFGGVLREVFYRGPIVQTTTLVEVS